ncbi:MAG: recombinase family protein [Sneathiella sp.]
MKIGFARVSTRWHSTEVQLSALKAEGCERVWQEDMAEDSSTAERVSMLIRDLNDGDTVIVTRLDQIARSSRELMDFIDAIHKQGAKFKSIAEPWADTTQENGDILLTVLSGLNQFEKNLATSQAIQGREHARMSGVKFGRPKKLSEKQQKKAEALLKQGKTAAEIGRLLDVSRSTISRLKKSKLWSRS